MKTSLLVLALSLFGSATAGGFDIVKRADRRSEAAVKSTEQFGEPHGNPFSDLSVVQDAHSRPRTITMWGCDSGEHFAGMHMVFETLSPPYKHSGIIRNHGTGQGVSGKKSFRLADNEYIKQVDVRTWRAKRGFGQKRRTRIGSITFTTSKGTTYNCGDYNASNPSKSWFFQNYAFLFFSGSEGEAIDALVANFIPVNDYYA